MSKQLAGKCWIYKRATLYVPDQKPVILDYTNGVEPVDCSTVMIDSDGLYFNWEIVPNNIVPIPLNVSRHNTYSIIRQGSIVLDDGSEVQWEFIFGKFQTHADYNMSKFNEYLPFLILILILVIKVLS